MSGTLTGLPGGQFALLLVSLSYGGCEGGVETGVMRGWDCTIQYCTVLYCVLYCILGRLDMWDQGDGETATMGEAASRVQELNSRAMVLSRDDLAGVVVRSCLVEVGVVL